MEGTSSLTNPLLFDPMLILYLPSIFIYTIQTLVFLDPQLPHSELDDDRIDKVAQNRPSNPVPVCSGDQFGLLSTS